MCIGQAIVGSGGGPTSRTRHQANKDTGTSGCISDTIWTKKYLSRKKKIKIHN
jgi:hypothetical protein